MNIYAYNWHLKATKLGYDSERHMLSKMYYDFELSMREIANMLNCGVATIQHRMRRLKMPTRRPGGPHNKPRFSHIPTEELFALSRHELSMKYNCCLATISMERGRRRKPWKSALEQQSDSQAPITPA